MSSPSGLDAWLPLLADQVLPDDATPGAGAAGVAEYLRQVLHGPRGRTLADVVEGIVHGLGRIGVDRTHFQALSFDARRQRVQQVLEAEPTAWHRFWRPFATCCLEGWLCDPRRGGNRDSLGWHATGLHGPGPAGNLDEA